MIIMRIHKSSKLTFCFSIPSITLKISNIIILIIITCLPQSAFAQSEKNTGKISGTITDRISSNLLIGASVNIADT